VSTQIKYHEFISIFIYIVQISTVPGPISIAGGGLNGNYIFDQMHFHWASEHTINGGR
jgi:carbonic anhydrase